MKTTGNFRCKAAPRVLEHTTHWSLPLLLAFILVLLASCGGGSASPPEITQQPMSQTVNVGQTATFTVSATGAMPLTYQWQKNGANISGATSATYTTPATTSADSGAMFGVTVMHSTQSVASSLATLTVNGPAKHHVSASESNSDSGPNGHILSNRHRHGSIELSMAEEPGKYRGSDVSKLHDASHHKRRQWNELPSNCHQSSYECDE